MPPVLVGGVNDTFAVFAVTDTALELIVGAPGSVGIVMELVCAATESPAAFDACTLNA